MSDLISRKALIDILAKYKFGAIKSEAEREYTKETVMNFVKEQPTVEAVPVVHGTWINTDGHDEWECDNCGYLICGYDDEPSKGEMKFCNMCGADMRKKV